jgi:peptidylprolyl isomerase
MIKEGSIVSVHYTGTLSDGVVFDSSVGREPINFEIGSGQVIPGFENAVMGMEVGQTTRVDIPHSEAYGSIDESLIISVSRDQVPEGVEVGTQLQGLDPSGRPFNVVVSEVNESDVKINANHPLAGKDLTFEIEVVEIK